jgi:hypothetical protein
VGGIFVLEGDHVTHARRTLCEGLRVIGDHTLIVTPSVFGRGLRRMGSAIRRIQKRNKARNTLSDLMSHPEHVVVIHYSCESFYDRPDGSSPRITSIAVRNLESAQTTSFSIHQMAKRNGYSIDQIDQRYDHLEKMMLDEFYEYVRTHLTYKWLHWNMRDINYGFQAIAHRYRVLRGEPVEIYEANLVDKPASSPRCTA